MAGASRQARCIIAIWQSQTVRQPNLSGCTKRLPGTRLPGQQIHFHIRSVRWACRACIACRRCFAYSTSTSFSAFACTAFGARIDPSLYESMGNRCIDWTARRARFLYRSRYRTFFCRRMESASQLQSHRNTLDRP